ncbi:ferredoxin III [Fulvivirga imtechensis AK7]|uniref:Ferredoxin III n=1 Tax=Fulvivirga imtechensis AK7 TaxID=1237149 RepID=L8JWN4_9BACT|nr:ferredoxin [Fulvivirga imtechensis]ELR73466.1 ferredoxin III [Fulvivirga imtechensis AK7]
MIRIIQYRDKCIGCNACVEAAPDRWRISRQDGKSILVGGKQKKNTYSVLVSDIELPENLRAATHCPVNIIKVNE